ncbi:MAG: Gx transporter family protein [Clostridia bacterium]
MNNSRKVATYSLLISLCLILSYVEAIIPFNFAIPGIKLGLSNIVVLFTLYKLGVKSAFCINLLRILLAGFLFSHPVTIIYSLCGGFLSFLGMVITKSTKILSPISVSVTGGVFHNIGQIIAASVMLSSDKVVYYLPVLLFFGLITGLLTGYVGAIVVERTTNI